MSLDCNLLRSTLSKLHSKLKNSPIFPLPVLGEISSGIVNSSTAKAGTSSIGIMAKSIIVKIVLVKYDDVSNKLIRKYHIFKR